MTIKRVTAGTGYRYLMNTVAVGDGGRTRSTALTRYYAESGNPPGRWLGAGLTGLAGGQGMAAGSTVTEQQMFQLFGMGADPVTGAPLGARPYRVQPTSDESGSRPPPFVSRSPGSTSPSPSRSRCRRGGRSPTRHPVTDRRRALRSNARDAAADRA